MVNDAGDARDIRVATDWRARLPADQVGAAVTRGTLQAFVDEIRKPRGRTVLEEKV